ncbi:hypothetical protein [Pseudarthrobacter sp. PvP022]
MKNAKPQIPGTRPQTVPASPEVPEDKPEAQAAHTFSGTFTDSGGVTSLDRARQSKRRTAIRTVVAALAAAAVVTLAVVAGNMGSINSPAPGPAASNTGSTSAPSSGPSASSSAAAADTPKPSASAVPPPAPSEPDVGWQAFTSANGKVTFDHPASWDVVPLSGDADGNAVRLEVTDDAGMFVAELVYGVHGGLGGGCEGPRPYSVLDTEEMQLPYNPGRSDVTPRFIFRAVETGSGVNASLGITSTRAGVDGKSCMFYNVVNGPEESPTYMFADAVQVNSAPLPDDAPGVKEFATVGDAQAYMKTPGYLNARRMITSLQINAG